MGLKCVIVVIIFNLVFVFCEYADTIPTTRTYDLQVPGSDPIRIIETEPLWDRHPQDTIVGTTTDRIWSDYEHRAAKPIIQTNPNFVNIDKYNDDQDNDDTTYESSEELKKFLKLYANNIRRATTTKSPSDDEFDFNSSENFHKVPLITKLSDEPTNRLANLYLEKNNKNDDLELEDKSHGWNLLNLKRHKHPTDAKNGWVSLEVVPWSVSKVAKWQSSTLKTLQDKSWINKNTFSDYNGHSGISKPYANYQQNIPLVTYNPSNSNHKTKPFRYGSAHMENKPNPRPGFSVPSTVFDQKVHIQQDYTDEIPRPPWNTKNYQSTYYTKQDNKDENCEGLSEIITDGLPSNFPKSVSENNRRKGSFQNEDHPTSHPFNGNGEWVLLTTTKGYKSPNVRQRSLDIEAQPFDDNSESINTHKSIRLTVLPPLKDSKINMTTSHGGLLQVESTFQSVDEAQKIAAKKQSIKKRPVRRRPINKPNKQNFQNLDTVTVTPTLGTRNKLHSASSVLAAVGAGMIPATMAMLVPMAMGKRKKRDLLNIHRNTLQFDFQLPKPIII